MMRARRACINVVDRQDTITGLLLAGIGQVERGKKNFLVVDSSEYIIPML